VLVAQADRERIAAAIEAAERTTAGEIFCVLARHSSEYRLVPLAWAAGLALLVPAPLIYFTLWPAWTIYVAQLAVFVLAAIGLSWPPLRFHIVPRAAAHDRAHAEAMRQFFGRGLHLTEKRTGVLIFASAAERYAEVVADAGIAAKVTQDAWDGVVAVLVAELKAGRAADGFIAAVAHCGTILAEHFPPGALPRNELPNTLVEI
jgi:putative membrane protein